jgi:hypothetical protein
MLHLRSHLREHQKSRRVSMDARVKPAHDE